jgi:hypothetical protein
VPITIKLACSVLARGDFDEEAFQDEIAESERPLPHPN